MVFSFGTYHHSIGILNKLEKNTPSYRFLVDFIDTLCTIIQYSQSSLSAVILALITKFRTTKIARQEIHSMGYQFLLTAKDFFICIIPQTGYYYYYYYYSLSLSFSLSLTHTHTNTHIETYTLEHTHTHTHTHTEAHTHTQTTHVHMHTHTNTHTQTHPLTHRHTHI